MGKPTDINGNIKEAVDALSRAQAMARESGDTTLAALLLAVKDIADELRGAPLAGVAPKWDLSLRGHAGDLRTARYSLSLALEAAHKTQR
jgi:hypothetical protein